MKRITLVSLGAMSLLTMGCQRARLSPVPLQSQAARFPPPPSQPINPPINPTFPPATGVVNQPPFNPIPVQPPIRPPVQPPIVPPPVQPPVIPPVQPPPVNPPPPTVTTPPGVTIPRPPTTTNPTPVTVTPNPTYTPPTTQPVRPVTPNPTTTSPVTYPIQQPPVVRSNPPTTTVPVVPPTTTRPTPVTPGPTTVAPRIPTPVATESRTSVRPVVPVATPVPAPVPVAQRKFVNAPLPPRRPTDLLAKPETQKPARPAIELGYPEIIRPKYEPIAGECKPGSLSIATPKKQLDILFVVDTSASLRLGPNNTQEGGELPQIARDMENFVRNLPTDTDYRIGMVLAHSPQSKHFGKLFSIEGQPAVLDSTKMTSEKMWSTLEKMMLSVPDEKSDAQGEALLLAIREAAVQNKAFRSRGLFRDNTNVAIIAVTDEQDVCYQYPQKASASNDPSGAMFEAGLVPVLKPKAKTKKETVLGADRHEERFGKSRYCLKGADGRPVTAENVARRLRLLEYVTSGKVIMNAIAYKSNQGLKARTGNEDENEMAHGVLELVEKFGGQTADLKNVDRSTSRISFADQLNMLGAATSFQIKHDTVFPCASNVHPNAVDPSTLEVTLSENGQRVARLSGNCQSANCQSGDIPLKTEVRKGTKAEPNPHLRIMPADQEGFTKLLSERRVEKGDYTITFKTKAGINPETGLASGEKSAKSEANTEGKKAAASKKSKSAPSKKAVKRKA